MPELQLPSHEKSISVEDPKTPGTKRPTLFVKITVVLLGATLAAFALHHVLSTLKTDGATSAAQAQSAPVADVPQPTREADFASAKYMPVPSNGSASFKIEMGDADHNGTGQQGVLLETLDISSIDEDPLNASTTGYHFFLYNHGVHTSKSGETKCDLNQVVNGYSVLMFDVDGEGLVKVDRIAQEGQNAVGYYPGADCHFIITGVHSTGTIPDDVWARSEAMWKQAQAATDAPAPTTN
jgi:hypothetical protein